SLGECGDPEAIHSVVITQLAFTQLRADGTIEGFDLDGTDSAPGDPAGCGHGDRSGPEGQTGIDSAFASLVPVLEGLGAGAVEGLIQQAIDSGELLLLIEMSHLDDWAFDTCADVALHRGQGTPIIGTDGTILVDQTFGLSPDVPSTYATGGMVEDGAFEIHNIEITLPVQILDVFLTFTMPAGAIHLDLASDGTVSGFLAGGVPVDQITSQIGGIPDIGDLSSVIPPLIEAAADLYPDPAGACTALSLGFDIAGKPAFIYRETSGTGEPEGR
ncbi:MAG: hypothetical protein VX000_11755, partial [Myxococcota bacterium]|nr:hypothetical protein [Myxococcota bacterium]